MVSWTPAYALCTISSSSLPSVESTKTRPTAATRETVHQTPCTWRYCKKSMARIIVALALLGGAAAQLTIDAVNPKVVEADQIAIFKTD